MGTVEIFLCVLFGHFIAAQSVIKEQDVTFPQEIPGFFENFMPFPFKRNFDFTPYDTIFSSWRTRTPDFHMLAASPPIMNVPKVEVFCDDSELTLLVDKRSNGVALTAEDVQLGDGCYSNGELPNQFVLTYSLDKCGTTRVVQNGLEMFTNTLHLNLKAPLNWWQTPTIGHISCIPKRPYDNSVSVSTVPSENGKTFSIKAMKSSWTGAAESNTYERGQVVNLQVSAKIRPEQQLFIHSCFVSASPEPHTRPRHAVIMNKGCTSPLGSSNAVIQFVASNRADVINFALNTSYLISELYVHCSVLVSDQGVTFSSKSCNYNVFQSRWEDLSGAAEVCECCSSKCKGLSVKHLPEDARAVVSIGPLVIVDKQVERIPQPPISEPQDTPSAPVDDSMQSDGAAAEGSILAGASVSRNPFSSPPRGVVVVSQDPVVRLTLWLPGQVQGAEHGNNVGADSEDGLKVQFQEDDMMANDLPELQPPTTEQEALLNAPTNKNGDKNADEPGGEAHMWDLNLLTLADGWAIPPPLEKESQSNMRFNPIRDELAQRRAAAPVVTKEGTNDAQPIIRSKLQFSKAMDGFQTLSYEEDVIRRSEADGTRGKREASQRGLLKTFLDLLRKMDKAE
ncbi:zona pellucida protein C [Pempheris klunzingeri]|uniref:zona pellucida protein C n=1 Tax=Pempheris klunzingeri TaxID=3127111 RepID=UPI0039808CE0